MFTTAIATAAIALSALAPAHHANALRPCTDTVRTTCVATASNDSGRFVIRDTHGTRHALHNGAAVLAYAASGSRPCTASTHASCYHVPTHTDETMADGWVKVGTSRYWLDNQG